MGPSSSKTKDPKPRVLPYVALLNVDFQWKGSISVRIHSDGIRVYHPCDKSVKESSVPQMSADQREVLLQGVWPDVSNLVSSTDSAYWGFHASFPRRCRIQTILTGGVDSDSNARPPEPWLLKITR